MAYEMYFGKTLMPVMPEKLEFKMEGNNTTVVMMNQGEVMFDAPPRQVFSHYKELESVGLAAPQVTYLVNELRERGLPVSTDATTPKEAAQAILKALQKTKG